MDELLRRAKKNVKKKAPPFTKLEIEILCHCMNNHKEVLECVESNKYSPVEKKLEWDLVEKEFNDMCHQRGVQNERTVEKLKKCWANLKCRTRKQDTIVQNSKLKQAGLDLALKMSKLETDILISCINNHKQILECTDSSKCSPEEVEHNWNLVADEFNDNCRLHGIDVERDVTELKNYWDNLKSRTRIQDTTLRNYKHKQTGGGPALNIDEDEEEISTKVRAVVPTIDFTLDNEYDSTGSFQKIDPSIDEACWIGDMKQDDHQVVYDEERSGQMEFDSDVELVEDLNDSEDLYDHIKNIEELTDQKEQYENEYGSEIKSRDEEKLYKILPESVEELDSDIDLNEYQIESVVKFDGQMMDSCEEDVKFVKKSDPGDMKRVDVNSNGSRIRTTPCNKNASSTPNSLRNFCAATDQSDELTTSAVSNFTCKKVPSVQFGKNVTPPPQRNKVSTFANYHKPFRATPSIRGNDKFPEKPSLRNANEKLMRVPLQAKAINNLRGNISNNAENLGILAKRIKKCQENVEPGGQPIFKQDKQDAKPWSERTLGRVTNFEDDRNQQDQIHRLKMNILLKEEEFWVTKNQIANLKREIQQMKKKAAELELQYLSGKYGSQKDC